MFNPKEPLDTSLAFRANSYNFYTIKRKGLHGMNARPLKPIREDTKNIPTKMHSFVIRSTSPNKKKAKSTTRRNISTDTCTSATNSNVSSHHTSRSPPKNKSPSKHTVVLELKFFNEIKAYDNEQMAQEGKLERYTSEGIQALAKWGMNVKKTMEKLNVFGRIPRHVRMKTEVPEYNIDSLMKLAEGDIRLYIPSKNKYKQAHDRAIIQQLLVRSNAGIKYRKYTG
eukprot:TRINITY_DN9012_c0_g1_i4.p1 TRINITY_DN9012_c0_g1~~TRINITY_DN9012_c0_g1_i4.p1  ORF type:complete len:226 (+),score=31.45 TRINITY_DN9012_c0_g1_i4:150-827(+)